ncbi:hypothetical protein B3286c1_0125 [Brucella vulpis]|uniref:hypothetical protein n=1 Tax=Brucella vulpis TaxID=981386 RepID=UPI00073AD3D8|nr:hypothetical protein BF3285c1_0127 [Brucella vulpis]CUW48963.1 hypothetical protein B3286c1_0125 [Brucella vulpis]
MKNPSIFGSSQKRGVLIPICSRFESVTFRESEAILTLPEVCQQSEGGIEAALFSQITILVPVLYRHFPNGGRNGHGLKM